MDNIVSVTIIQMYLDVLESDSRMRCASEIHSVESIEQFSDLGEGVQG